MSENKAPAKTEKTDAKAAKPEKDKTIQSREVPKRQKTVWTLERCMKYARRFSSEGQWASGASSSYKSAVARGWVAQCVAELQKNGSSAKANVVPGKFAKNTKSGHLDKKAA